MVVFVKTMYNIAVKQLSIKPRSVLLHVSTNSYMQVYMQIRNVYTITACIQAYAAFT